jgi:hypothetical protein
MDKYYRVCIITGCYFVSVLAAYGFASPVFCVVDVLPRPPALMQTMQIMRPKPVKTFAGTHILAAPRNRPLEIRTTTVNHSSSFVTIFKGGPFGSRLSVFDASGTRLRSPAFWTGPGGSASGHLFYLAPGASTKNKFVLKGNAPFNATGVFYVYISRIVVEGKWGNGPTTRIAQKTIRSPILKLTLRKGRPPLWQVVSRVPRPPPRPMRHQRGTFTPHYPPYRIPTTGPIAVLAQISKAVRAGNIQAVKQLCLHGSRQPPPLYVANAEEAIALASYCAAIGKQFGHAIGAKALRGLGQIHPSPEGFSHTLKVLNFRSLRIKGDRASVGTFWFNGKEIVPMPKFAFRFRKVNGHWLLDSRASYRSTITPRGYHLNAENSIKEAQLFDSLSRELAAGRFATLAEFTAVADRMMAAEDDWFTSQSLHGTPRPVANSGRPAVTSSWAVSAHGVGITLAPGTGTNLIATLANNGNQMASALSGGPFGWSLFVFGGNGRGMGISPKEQARLRAAARPVGGTALTPGGAVRKTFNIARYCVLPAHGTFYVYASRFITVGGASTPIRSSILKVILRKGQPPLWQAASSLPKLKLR